jgi:hypothetical protein
MRIEQLQLPGGENHIESAEALGKAQTDGSCRQRPDIIAPRHQPGNGELSGRGSLGKGFSRRLTISRFFARLSPWIRVRWVSGSSGDRPSRLKFPLKVRVN